MAALAIDLGQHVEQEWLHVEIQRLVIQKQLRQETEILTVDLVIAAVHLEDGNSPLAIDLPPERLPQLALAQVLDVGGLQSHVLEAVLADPELSLLAVLLWVGREVPGVYLVFSDDDLVDVLDFRERFVLLL